MIADIPWASRAGPTGGSSALMPEASAGRWRGSEACCLAGSTPLPEGTGPAPRPGADWPLAGVCSSWPASAHLSSSPGSTLGKGASHAARPELQPLG